MGLVSEMSIDIYHSRRTNYRECKYFVRDESSFVGDLDRFILTQAPRGVFYAKEISPQNSKKDQVANVILYDKSIITLETTDIVDDLTSGCVVLYLGHGWMVEQVQRSVYMRETEFGEMKYKTIISIRR